MLVTVLKTFVETTPKGMIVGNPGDEIDIFDEALLERLLAADKIEAPDFDAADLDAMTAPVVGDDGAPLDPPAGDVAADIAAPAEIKADAEPVKNKGGRPKKPAASALDAPLA